MKKRWLLYSLCLTSLTALTQKKNEAFRLHIHKTATPITIDGLPDEVAWTDAATATDFFMVLPMDTSHARVRTEVKMTYDNQNLYMVALCYHAVPGPYFVESLRRDFVFGKNDNFLLFMDPFDDQTNGFSFGSNAAGAQWDGTMYSGGSVDLNWDHKWTSAVKYDAQKWVFEMAIPFKTIRYKKGVNQWGINFSRLDLKTTEKSSWAPVPRQFPTASLAYSGVLVWDQPPPDPGSNVSLIPYMLGRIIKNYEPDQPSAYEKKAGGDIKIAVTSALNLDLTINPDFSQVEVDRQVTNLERFELFFPERRQFFLENADLFANFGYSGIRPFFSRRIGLGVPIRGGARLSGRVNRNWRLGVMDMQTGSVAETGLPAQNFAIVSLQRRVFSRSNVGLLLINKESVDYHPGQDSSKPVYSKYNRNIGLEYNLASSNNVWTGKALLLKSFSPGKAGKDITAAGHLQYSSRKWNLLLQQEYVGLNYTAEVGYVPRRDYYKINPVATRLFFPKGSSLLSHGPAINATYYFDGRLHKTDYINLLSYAFNFRNQAVFTVSAADEFVKLLQPFDPTNFGKDTLSRDTRHHWKAWRTSFVSKPQSLFSFAFDTRGGGYYMGGTRTGINGEVGYRFQPYVKLLANASFNDIHLPTPWGHTTFWLVGSQIDITFTNQLFLSTFLQYNQQLNNVNVNTRFQWRYKPASDLFIVYTDNYFPSPFFVRNRALVLKLNYWWN